MSNVPSNVILPVADDLLAQGAFIFHVLVNLLVALHRAVIEESLEANFALDERLVLRVNRLMYLKRCHPFKLLITDCALILEFI